MHMHMGMHIIISIIAVRAMVIPARLLSSRIDPFQGLVRHYNAESGRCQEKKLQKFG